MQVKGLDHVNIIALDLGKTIDFYDALLGLKANGPMGMPMGERGAWLYDEAGRPIIHVVTYSEESHGVIDRGSATGLLDHVAFACEGFATMLERVVTLGIEHNTREFGDMFKQINITDPNNVKLELNFNGN